MFETLRASLVDKDFPLRTATLLALRRVLDGEQYSHLQYSFQEEKSPAEEYIPLRHRRPSVRTNLCRVVVDDSVRLLFGEGHFPDVVCSTEEGEDLPQVKKVLKQLIKELSLPEVMVDAATKGSIGSVCLRMRVLSKRVFVDALCTVFLTPEWDPVAPDTLMKVTERYKVKGAALREAGYSIKDEELATEFWFQRVWDSAREIWYQPWRVMQTEGQKPAEPEVDAERTVTHSLGFVPLLWIKNLPGSEGIDGCSTFKLAIDTVTDIDYLLSQAGRGLRFMADPTLVIKEDAMQGQGGKLQKGPNNALSISATGDAKLLEINGTGAHAVIQHVRLLRELALEAIHGNRTTAEKMNVAQSGKAMEMMNQALVGLADQLRSPYGEKGLIDLLLMILRAHEKLPLVFKNGKEVPKISDDLVITLRWPAWYAPTAQDRVNLATALRTQTDGGFMSRETAQHVIAKDYDVEDPKAETERIEADRKQLLAEAKIQANVNA